MKIVKSSILLVGCFCLCAFSSPVNAEGNVLTAGIDVVTSVVKKLENWATAHQAVINKEKALPAVATLDDDALSLVAAARSLRASVVDAVLHTESDGKIQVDYKQRLIKNSERVKRMTQDLSISLQNAARLLRTAEAGSGLVAANGKVFDSSEFTRVVTLGIDEKTDDLTSIQQVLLTGPVPINSTKYAEIRKKATAGLNAVESIHKATSALYVSLGGQHEK